LESSSSLFTDVSGSNREFSSATCPPLFYDEHSGADMILEQVVSLPSLVENFAKLLIQRSKSLQNPFHLWVTSSQQNNEKPTPV
jgi:hypothetical protein